MRVCREVGESYKCNPFISTVRSLSSGPSEPKVCCSSAAGTPTLSPPIWAFLSEKEPVLSVYVAGLWRFLLHRTLAVALTGEQSSKSRGMGCVWSSGSGPRSARRSLCICGVAGPVVPGPQSSHPEDGRLASSSATFPPGARPCRPDCRTLVINDLFLHPKLISWSPALQQRIISQVERICCEPPARCPPPRAPFRENARQAGA